MRSKARARRYHCGMGADVLVVLIIVLIIVLVWRGPKTLPKLGEALGRGVREARKEAESIRSETSDEGDAASGAGQGGSTQGASSEGGAAEGGAGQGGDRPAV